MIAVPGYEKYLVNESGEVYSTHTGNGLKKYSIKKGYRVYGLAIGKDKIKWIGGHRLVAFAYIPNPHNHPFVNHIDGNKENNKRSNLEWISRLGNAQHAAANGLYRVRGQHGRARLVLNTKTGIYYGCVVDAAISTGLPHKEAYIRNMLYGRVPNHTGLMFV
jgi:hypothetical protein